MRSRLIVALVAGLGAGTFVQAASTVQFAASSYTVAENAGSVTLTVQRSGDTNVEASVDYRTADGSATNGWKYSAVSGTLAFGLGKPAKKAFGPPLTPRDCPGPALLAHCIFLDA